jgi:ERCC4-type nuclease
MNTNLRRTLPNAEIDQETTHAERGGTQVKTPRPVLLVDTREQVPLDFSRFAGWFTGIERKALKLGDYSVAGMEDICVVERKDLSDLIHSCTTDRCVFINRLRQMAQYPHRLLLVTSSLSQIKSPYSHGGNPNRITQSLIAMLAGLQIPFYAVKPMSWTRKSSPPIFTKCISTIGLRQTILGAS